MRLVPEINVPSDVTSVEKPVISVTKMATNKLTDTSIKTAKPKSSEYALGDGGGLYLKIKPNGLKNWIFRYTRPIVGGVTNMGLGSYPNVSLADARKAAQESR